MAMPGEEERTSSLVHSLGARLVTCQNAMRWVGCGGMPRD
jgi:hypothetical protein